LRENRFYALPFETDIDIFGLSLLQHRAAETNTTVLRNIHRKLKTIGFEDNKFPGLLARFYDETRPEDCQYVSDFIGIEKTGYFNTNGWFSGISDSTFRWLIQHCLKAVSLKIRMSADVTCYRRYLTFYAPKDQTIYIAEFDSIFYYDRVDLLRNLLDFPPPIYHHFYPAEIDLPIFPKWLRDLCCSIKCIVTKNHASEPILHLLTERGYRWTRVLGGWYHAYLAPDIEIIEED
jgi:hypothetical protein